MSQNILITGAAGYIGGSVLADFISRPNGPVKPSNINAVVRSEEQAQELSKLGVNVIQLELSNESAVMTAVVSNETNVVDSQVVSGLINGLGRRREMSGKEAYFIHSSVATLFSAEGGWPYGEIKDTDPVLEKEKSIARGHPVRDASILVSELSKALGVTSFIIPVPQVYGRGTGEWRKLSVAIPAAIKSSIKHKMVHKFDKDASPPSVHVSDLAAFYTLLTEKIVQREPVASGEDGYYFVYTHKTHWWDTMQRLAEALYARGLVTAPTVETWSSDEMAAEYLGFPRPFVRAMGTNSPQLVPVKASELGWQPKWDEERFLSSLDDEIQAVLESDPVMNTVSQTLVSGK
ncbi:hypothetical protein BP6252_05942 [Coleophoma cylindrospora]|uniref:NmrA-like domain-containing protein n=1 Tax=Coleophoma cylindrospora TaxID=1849047 RepID=A0A3D8RLH1_9HELO|nr:hypothetical protein BP6252_05942 [Coleophoma cylindrospora]